MGIMTEFLGEPVTVWFQVQSHFRKLGYESVEEFLKAQEEPEEYQATNSLLKARLKRIQGLAGLEIKEAA